MSDTKVTQVSEEAKAAKSQLWKFIYWGFTGILGVLCLWAFQELNNSAKQLAGQAAEMQAIKKENQAQWLLLRENTARQQEYEVELRSTNRLFDLLVNKGKLEVGVPGAGQDETASPRVEPSMISPPREDLDSFRQRQMVEYQQRILEK